jgi:hypothetical protein
VWDKETARDVLESACKVDHVDLCSLTWDNTAALFAWVKT